MQHRCASTTVPEKIGHAPGMFVRPWIRASTGPYTLQVLELRNGCFCQGSLMHHSHWPDWPFCCGSQQFVGGRIAQKHMPNWNVRSHVARFLYWWYTAARGGGSRVRSVHAVGLAECNQIDCCTLGITKCVDAFYCLGAPNIFWVGARNACASTTACSRVA